MSSCPAETADSSSSSSNLSSSDEPSDGGSSSSSSLVISDDGVDTCGSEPVDSVGDDDDALHCGSCGKAQHERFAASFKHWFQPLSAERLTTETTSEDDCVAAPKLRGAGPTSRQSPEHPPAPL